METPEELQIKAVLDHTALLSYASAHVHVGELVHEVSDEENSVVAIPSVALTRARARALENPHARALLDYLVTMPRTVVLSLDLATAPQVAQYVPGMRGDISRAHAVWTSTTFEAPCFTTEPDAYPNLVIADQIVAIPTEDA